MQYAFEYCRNISGEIEINANVTGEILENDTLDYKNCFHDACIQENCQVKISGSCSILEDIIADTNNPKIIL